MCSPKAEVLISEIIADKVNTGEMFTALDISREVQEELKKDNLPFERHRELRGTIHQIVQVFITSGAYARTLKDVGAPVDAYVYHPEGSDPDNYVPIGGSPAPKPVSGTIDVVLTSSPSSTATLPSTGSNSQTAVVYERKPDARGTVSIPSQVIEELGLSTGKDAYVYKVKGEEKIVVTSHSAASNDCEQIRETGTPTRYRVDHGGNIRITQAILDKVFANGPSKFDVTYDSQNNRAEVVAA